MIKTEATNVTGPMTKGEAKALTDRIHQAVDGLGALVEQAHDRGAWKALSYATWEAYVKAEFGFTRQRSYQLLDQGRVAKELAVATGDLSNAFDISARDAAAVKDDLPAVKAIVKARVDKGDEPAAVVAETVAAARAEKEKQREEKKAQQAENDRQREENRAKLNPDVQRIEQAKQRNGATNAAVAGLSPADRIAELEESVRVLEAENATLKAENKRFAEMKVEFDRGGFDEVIRGKDEVISTLKTRVERESEDKVSWKRSSDMWRKRAEESGWSNDVVIEIPGRAAHG